MSPRLVPLPWEKIVWVFEKLGFQLAGQKGSHIKMEKPGVARPLIIPRYEEVGKDVIMNLIRTAGISREKFLELLQDK